jgi:hypothetical protein
VEALGDSEAALRAFLETFALLAAITERRTTRGVTPPPQRLWPAYGRVDLAGPSILKTLNIATRRQGVQRVVRRGAQA